MILRTLQVEGWRCFAERIPPLGPLGDGLNVIHGPNGVGKSTLIWALTRALFDSHKVGGADIQSLQPWGKALTPRVIVEFEHDGEMYQIDKQFIKSPFSKLSRKVAGHYEPLADGIDADDWTRRMLSADTPARGLSDQRHWGFAQVLWATQGDLRIRELSDGTRNTIREALGGQVSDSEVSARIQDKIVDAFNEIYTASGKVRSGALAPRITALQKQLEDARQQQETLRSKLEEFETTSRRVEDLDNLRFQAERDDAHVGQQCDQAEQQARKYRELVVQRESQEEKIGAARAKFEQLQQRVEEYDRACRDLTDVQQEVERHQQDAPSLSAELETRRRESEEAKVANQAAKSKRPEVAAAQSRTRVAEELLRAQQRLRRIELTLADSEAAESELDSLRRKRGEVVAPEKKALRAITDALHKQEVAQGQLDVALISVTILPECDLSVEVISGEHPGVQSLSAEKMIELRGAPEITFKLPGIGTFRATGPTGSVEPLRDELAAIDARLAKLTEPLGTSDLDLLHQRRADADDLDQQIERLQVKIDTLLAEDDVEMLRSDRSQLAARVEQILEAQAGWRESPPEVELLRAAAEAAQREFDGAVERTEAAQQRAATALGVGEKKLAVQQSALQAAERRMQDTRRRLDSLQGDGFTDAERRRKLGMRSLDLESGRSCLKEIQALLAEFGVNPSDALDVLRRQRRSLEEGVRKLNEDLIRQTERLDMLGAEAPYSMLAAVEETISRLEHEEKREQTRIDAIRLLYEAMSQQQKQIAETVIGPIRVKASQTMRRIMGTRFKDIEFSEDLLPTKVTPTAHDEAVSIDYLSGGEQEQVYFAGRLALADVAFRDERQLVVLDDSFQNTDTPSLARIATILEEAASRFQIVLLSCHPERYRHLSNAQFFDLEEIASRATP
ncbi:MAG: SMC family ATPase [Planctomycetes bacterium]|nr:SMC family ATPase [Planctomycetota bacterium]